MKYRMPTVEEKKAWGDWTLGNGSWLSYWSDLGMESAVEIGRCGNGSKNHKLEIKYINSGEDRAIISIGTICGTGMTHYGKHSQLVLNEGTLNCLKCAKSTRA